MTGLSDSKRTGAAEAAKRKKVPRQFSNSMVTSRARTRMPNPRRQVVVRRGTLWSGEIGAGVAFDHRLVRDGINGDGLLEKAEEELAPAT